MGRSPAGGRRALSGGRSGGLLPQGLANTASDTGHARPRGRCPGVWGHRWERPPKLLPQPSCQASLPPQPGPGGQLGDGVVPRAQAAVRGSHSRAHATAAQTPPRGLRPPAETCPAEGEPQAQQANLQSLPPVGGRTLPPGNTQHYAFRRVTNHQARRPLLRLLRCRQGPRITELSSMPNHGARENQGPTASAGRVCLPAPRSPPSFSGNVQPWPCSRVSACDTRDT